MICVRYIEKSRKIKECSYVSEILRIKDNETRIVLNSRFTDYLILDGVSDKHHELLVDYMMRGLNIDLTVSCPGVRVVRYVEDK